MTRLGILAVALPSNGGTFQYTLSMLHSIKKCGGFQVCIYTSRTNNCYDDLGLPVRRLDLSRFELLRLAGSSLAGLKLRDPFVEEDLLLAPIYSPVLLHTNVPFAFTLHDLQERYLPHNFTMMQRAWRHFLQGRLSRKASRIICESSFVKSDIVRFFRVSPEKITVLPSPPVALSGADTPLAELESLKARLDLPEMFIFYPAQFWPHKNHERLVEAFSRVCERFPEVQLLFTGAKRDEFDNVFSRVRDLGLQGRVRHLGYLEQEELAALYKLALALVMPSLFESVSIPVYEAQQAGTPVCASGVLAIADQIGDSGLTFDPMSIDSIQLALEKILSDAPLRESLGSSGKRQFESMDWEHFDDRLQDFLDHLGGASAQSRGAQA